MPLGLQEVEARQSAHEGGNVISPMYTGRLYLVEDKHSSTGMFKSMKKFNNLI